MAVYYDIINWSNGKSLFVRDAIRRLLHSQTLTKQDVEEIKDLLKKECGFDNITAIPVPANDTDIPSIYNQKNQIRLQQILSPHNIAALYDKTPLVFSPNGLSVVYGKNGSGKSSYSKILKKLCWSRDKDIILKKNVYTGDDSSQSVKIIFLEGNHVEEFIWREGAPTDNRLNSIFVFDNKCAEIYLNKENPAEYKPAGIDVLERLVKLFADLSLSIDNDMRQLRKTKPQLIDLYKNTNIFNWYQRLEKLQRNVIDSQIVLTDQQKEKRINLCISLKDSNLTETNKNLKHKKDRYQRLLAQLNDIESLFHEDALKAVHELKMDWKIKEQANKLARNSYETDCEFSIGGKAWRLLWNAAKEYATTELHSSFPIASNSKGSYCVLCHQYLSDKAKERIKRFDLFIQDKTSLELERAKKEIEKKLKEYTNISQILITDDIKNELVEDNSNFAGIIEEYSDQVMKAKTVIINYINDTTQDVDFIKINPFLKYLSTEIEKIEKMIKANDDTLRNREKTEKDFLELDALYQLVNNKDEILAYYDEYVTKQKYNKCKSAVNTRAISSKIGELLESNAIAAQQGLFIQYLEKLNPKIAEKMVLKKTKTTSGITYQRCGFRSISEDVVDILSEGEQKIVAIANFLSECTIDNALNTIIFDDPINSLDIDYRESIAKIIVELSESRQIIVMTHDLYFLRLLKDIYKSTYSNECYVTCLNSLEDNSGIVSDEIPYLAKNVQERINTITSELDTIRSLDITQIDKKNNLLNDLKDKMRQLLERTVEDILINKTITRFSRNINFKKGNLAHIIVVEKSDIDYLLSLYGKYSEVIHDGSIETVSNLITESDMRNDITQYKQWKDSFVQRAKNWISANGYNIGG